VIAELIQTVLGPAIDEDALKEAYSLEHDDAVSRVWVHAVDRSVQIRGDFFARTPDCSRIGEFYRTISIWPSAGVVVRHDSIFIEAPFRERGIAKAHLSKALRFYDACGIKYIYMDANGFGPVVWPQLGFDCSERTQVAPIQETLRDLYQAETGERPESVPDKLPLLVAAQSPENPYLGRRTMLEYYNANGKEPIPLMLDLADETTRTFLGIRGIL
jgi:GNAT superfamily N-acetyltransferase